MFHCRNIETKKLLKTMFKVPVAPEAKTFRASLPISPNKGVIKASFLINLGQAKLPNSTAAYRVIF